MNVKLTLTQNEICRALEKHLRESVKLQDLTAIRPAQIEKVTLHVYTNGEIYAEADALLDPDTIPF